MQLILNGIAVGLLLSIMAGPIFITIIQLGVERGIRAGLAFSAGVLLSDCVYFYLVLMGMESIGQSPTFQLSVGLIGSALLIVFGLYSIFSKYKKPEEISVNAKTYGGYFLKGISINFLNPFVFILWTAISQEMITKGFTSHEQLVYFLAIIGSVGFVDLLKLILAKKIRPYLKPHHLRKVSVVAGVGLVIFGILLIVKVFKDLILV